MLISEIFYSIQGEGELTGVPSVFVRTSGCNLRCNWCDTMYASWEPEGKEMGVPEILQRVERFPQSRHCVLTGGEPMIAPEIRVLAQELRNRGKHVTIETAATIPPDGVACDLASLSPKLSNSRPDDRLPAKWQARHETTRIRPDVLRSWVSDYNYQLKFVICGPDDLEEVEALRTTLGKDIAASKILLMPEGISTDAIRSRDETLVDICKRRGYRYCNRLHVELFGHTRGT
jgi:7-carboxy-7-deazaguanine synthase